MLFPGHEIEHVATALRPEVLASAMMQKCWRSCGGSVALYRGALTAGFGEGQEALGRTLSPPRGYMGRVEWPYLRGIHGLAGVQL